MKFTYHNWKWKSNNKLDPNTYSIKSEISYSNLGPQLADTLFTQLVTEGAIQKFEMWKRGYQLLDCRQRYIPDEGHDLTFKNKNVFTISVCFSSGEQTTGRKHYLHIILKGSETYLLPKMSSCSKLGKVARAASSLSPVCARCFGWDSWQFYNKAM